MSTAPIPPTNGRYKTLMTVASVILAALLTFLTTATIQAYGDRIDMENRVTTGEAQRSYLQRQLDGIATKLDRIDERLVQVLQDNRE